MIQRLKWSHQEEGALHHFSLPSTLGPLEFFPQEEKRLRLFQTSQPQGKKDRLFSPGSEQRLRLSLPPLGQVFILELTGI